MKLNPIHTENIIVGIISSGSWYWCCTYYTDWILDMSQVINTKIAEERRDLEILDQNNIGSFLCNINEYMTSTAELRSLIFGLVEYAEDYWDMLDYLPSLFVDFDKEILISQFNQHNMFENYLPNDGWVGKHDDIRLYVPSTEKYWIRDGKCINDYFERGGNNLKIQI
ncbi:MAG TPA: hypothetical protein VF941_20745 [Clostridia bacterium]